MGNVKSRNDFSKTNRNISRNLSQPQLSTTPSSLTSSLGREQNHQQQRSRQHSGVDKWTTATAILTTETAAHTSTTTTAVGGPLVDVDVANTNDTSKKTKNNKAKEDPQQTRRQRQQKAADSSAACAVALTEQQQLQQRRQNYQQQRLKQASFWSLGSLNWNLSFSGRNSYKQRQKSSRKSFSTLQYQRRSKTQWHRPLTNAIFSSHFKESSRNGEFHIDRLVAKGAFGVVFRVVDKNSIQQRAHQQQNQQPHSIATDLEAYTSTPVYALKVLKKSKIISDSSVQQIKDEADIQKLCGHHPFIVKQFDLWQNRYNLHILSEFVPNGELFSKISTFSLSLIRVYLAEIALALDFLHNAGIIYRDAKPENILLTADYHLKLTDFGLSKWLKFGLTTKTICGTFQYMDYLKSRNLTQTVVKMNARSQVFDLTMEGRQVDEAVASIFHTVLFHRCLGKYMYTGDAQYSIGTVGYTDVDCDFIDFTYVCCTSDSLQRTVKRAINVFSEKLRSNESCGSGQISLEFFQKKKSRWPFTAECIPWEVWTIHLDLIKHEHEDERQMCRENVADLLTEKVIYITEIMNRHDYVPKTPSQSELDLIFDTTYPDVQPYLFKFVSSTSDYAAPSMGNAMKKIIKETLAL